VPEMDEYEKKKLAAEAFFEREAEQSADDGSEDYTRIRELKANNEDYYYKDSELRRRNQDYDNKLDDLE